MKLHSYITLHLIALSLFYLPAQSAEENGPLLSDFKPGEISIQMSATNRPLAEVKRIVSDFKTPSDAKPIHIIFAAGKKTHGTNAHDYPFFQKHMAALMGFGKNVTIDTSWIFPTEEQYEKADVIVFNSMMQDLTPEHANRLNTFITNGGGVVYVHIGIQAHKFLEQQAPNVGLVWSGRCRYRHGPVELDFTKASHPITEGFTVHHFYDETYWNLKGDRDSITVLATSPESDSKDEAPKPRPQLWVKEVGKGRIVANILGHYTWTYDDPLFRILLYRSIAWVNNDDLNRFNNLILPGARLD